MTSPITATDIIDAAKKLKARKIIVAIVCRPDTRRRVEEIVKEEAAMTVNSITGSFCTVPVFEKTGQVEPYKMFYDHESLREYLDEQNL